MVLLKYESEEVKCVWGALLLSHLFKGLPDIRPCQQTALPVYFNTVQPWPVSNLLHYAFYRFLTFTVYRSLFF